jgi:hypothetical protein
MTQETSVDAITSSVVPDELRLNFLPHYLGSQYLRGEALVYEWARRLAPMTVVRGSSSNCRTVVFTWLLSDADGFMSGGI